MRKRLRVSVFFLMLVFTGIPVTSIQAKTVNKVLLAEQAKGKAPNVRVYMTGSEMSSDVVVSGKVGDISLAQNGDIKPFCEAGEGLRVIILLDNSGSVDKIQFDEAKNQLKKLRRNLKEHDEIQIYTVGTLDVTSDKIDILDGTALAGDTEQVELDDKKIDEIPYIDSSAGKTILYRSLNQVLEEQSSQKAMEHLRTVILLVTDGEDDSDDVNGKDNDKDVTLENVKNSSIPVYGILLHNTAVHSNVEKIKFTKNKILDPDNGHGYYYNCGTDFGEENVKEAFDKIDQILREETYVVNLIAQTNKTAGKKELDLTVNNQSIQSVLLDYSDHDPDTTAPNVDGSVKKEGKNSVVFSMEDDNGVNFSDASDQTHYTIQTDDEDGKIWMIDQVNANKNGRSVSVTLTIKDEEFYNGNYRLTITGIRDESQEQNAMEKVKVSFAVEDGLDAGREARKEFIQRYWWIALLLLIMVIGMIVIHVIRRKSVNLVEKEVDPEQFNQSDTKMIRLTITEGVATGIPRDVEWNVEGSLFVGRSNICNIFFDDDRLSKQHFVIEVTKMGCYIEDLESTNGTFVNGVKMINRRPLLDGDVITAGREKIVFHVIGNQVIQEETDHENRN